MTGDKAAEAIEEWIRGAEARARAAGEHLPVHYEEYGRKLGWFDDACRFCGVALEINCTPRFWDWNPKKGCAKAALAESPLLYGVK